MFQTFISRHNSNFFSDKLVLTSVTPASSAPVLQTPKATSSTLYFDSWTVNAGNGGFLHCIQMDASVSAANQVVSGGADIAFDADPKFFACLVRFESSSVPTTPPTAYGVYALDGGHDGSYYTVKDTCRKRPHKVHRMEMKTAISCTILRHTKILIAVGV